MNYCNSQTECDSISKDFFSFQVFVFLWVIFAIVWFIQISFLTSNCINFDFEGLSILRIWCVKHMIKCWWMAMVMNYETMRRKVDMAAMGVEIWCSKMFTRISLGCFGRSFTFPKYVTGVRHSKRDDMATSLIMVTLASKAHEKGDWKFSFLEESHRFRCYLFSLWW